MNPKTPKLLEDVRDAAAFVIGATQGRTIDDHRSDRLLRQSIERNFEIIGEAVHRLSKLDPDSAAHISKHRQIIAFRHVLIHGYDLIDHRIAWSTIDDELPVPLEEVKSLLAGQQ